MAASIQGSRTHLYDISRQILLTLNLNEVVARILSNSVRYINAEWGMLILLDEKQQLDIGAVFLNGRIIPYDHDTINDLLKDEVLGCAMRDSKTFIIANTNQDARWQYHPDGEKNQSKPKSAICVPIRLNSEQLLGILVIVHSRSGFFNSRHAELLDAAADQAAIAIFNAQQYRALEKLQIHYQQLYEDNIDLVLITNWSGQILEANRMTTRVTGFSFEELTSRRINELYIPDWNILGEDYSMLRSGSVMVSFESELNCCETGKIIPIQVYVQKYVTNKEDYIQWVFRDISVRKELEALQNELLSMVYHDLRSPLGNVVSSLDMIKEMIPEELMENLNPLVDIAFRSTERVKNLADSLLDINRLEAGQKITDLKEVRIQRLVEEAICDAKFSAEARGHIIVNEISDEIPSLMVDEGMIRRVLLNLLENAIKFIPSNGRIVLGGKVEDQQAILWIEDNGPGIHPDEKERVFDKFTRLEVKNGPRGLGLGLAFCRLAVTAHGGKIWIEENQPHGSRFIFSLPIISNN